MKKQYFLKIANSFNRLKDLFKNNNDWKNEFKELVDITKNGDMEKFEKLFNRNNPYLNFSVLCAESIHSGGLEFFLKVEQKALELNSTKSGNRNFQKNYGSKEMRAFYYREALSFSSHFDNVDVVKYLINNNRITLKDIDDECLMVLSLNKSTTILQYLLYDLKVETSNNLIEKLLNEDEGNYHFNLVSMIKKRDLYFSLGKELDSSEIILQRRTNKI